MKIYIAGAITDNPNYIEQFKTAEEKLIAAGHIVINPSKNQGYTYKEFIDMGLFELMHCDAIYLLKGYENSTGATMEHDYARTVGLKILKEEDKECIKDPQAEIETDDVLLDVMINKKCVVSMTEESGIYVIYSDGSAGYCSNDFVKRQLRKTGEKLRIKNLVGTLEEKSR